MFRASGAGIVLVCALALPAAAQTMTLDEALGIAYETNPQLSAQQAALRATDEQVAQANAGYRPTINAQGSYGAERFGFTPIHPDPVDPTVTVTSQAEHPVQ